LKQPKQITRAEREARRAFRQVDDATAMSEYEIAQTAFSKNRERLEASLAHNDLSEHLDGPAVLRLLHFTNSTHT
jgi:hypothetical protein